jgi:quercetin dioxygenase-like cupin family protein
VTDPDSERASEASSAAHDVTDLPKAAARVLETARASDAGRAGHTLTPGAGAALKQILLALVAGRSLDDHESPGAATLQVLIGRVRLTAGGQEGVELRTGDHAPIPHVRHGLDALDDAVVLISVAQRAG